MHINVDTFITPDWTPDRLPRVFPIDVFLSHNKDDGSEALATQLSECGIVVWHDSNENLADRRVMQKVSKALFASRLIAVCVSSGYRDSIWVRAEYIPALRSAARHGISRVVVLKLHGNAMIPEELASCSQFEVYRTGLEEFLAFARDSNLVELPSFDEHMLRVTETSPTDELSGSDVAEVIKELAEVTDLLLQRDPFDGYQSAYMRLYYLRNLLCGESTEINAKTATHILSSAFRLATSSDADVRANGVMLVESLVKHGHVSSNALLSWVAREVSDDVLGLALPLLSDRWKEIQNGRSLIQLAALRAPRELARYPNLLADCPEVIRAFALARVGLVSGSLTVVEQCNWLDERLAALIHPDGVTVERDGLGRLVNAFGISEFELIFREAKHLLDSVVQNESSRDLESLASTYVLMTERLLNCTLCTDILASIGDWLFDYLFVPLLCVIELSEHRREAIHLYEMCCRALSGTPLEDEVPLYRRALEQVHSGQKQWNYKFFLFHGL